MPNWCYTSYIVEGDPETIDSLENLMTELEDLPEPYVKSDFGNTWLGCIVNKLGNKILLEDAINQSISNEWFRSKKQNSISQKSGYKDSRYHIANALTTYPSDVWTKEDIETATKKAAKRILDFIFA